MFSRILLIGLIASTVVSAQKARPAEGSGAPEMIGAPSTPFEHFVDKLQLDEKTQTPAVAEIFSAAGRDALPVATELFQLRLRMVAAEQAGKPEDVPPLLESYRKAAAKMSTIEVGAFAKVFALLKPNQQSKAPDAFVWMTGIFLPSAPRTPPAPRGGGDR